jgi:GT2 family glycosyltransferase
LKAGAIIVTYNSWTYLERCVEAIRTQTTPFHRIIIIDNASDMSLTESGLTLPTQFEFIRNDHNAGFAAANNRAVNALDDCDWIALINPDAFIAPDWLEKLQDAAKRNPDCSFFGSTLLIADNADMLDGTGDIYHMSGLAWRGAHGTARLNAPTIEYEVFSPCAAAALYRRDVFLVAGGFDEDFFCYMEDVDLGFRLRLAGHRCMQIPSAIAHHIGSATSGGQRSNFATYHGHRNLVWTYVKNMPAPLFWMLLPLHLLLNLMTIIAISFRGQTRTIWQAKWDALRGLPHAWHKRSEIQRRRVAGSAEIWRLLDKRISLKRHR